jgi:hypothetical protein
MAGRLVDSRPPLGRHIHWLSIQPDGKAARRRTTTSAATAATSTTAATPCASGPDAHPGHEPFPPFGTVNQPLGQRFGPGVGYRHPEGPLNVLEMGFLSVIGKIKETRQGNSHQNPQDGNDDHQLDQGEPRWS